MDSISIMIIIGLVVLLICRILMWRYNTKHPSITSYVGQCHCDGCNEEENNLITLKLCKKCFEKYWDNNEAR